MSTPTDDEIRKLWIDAGGRYYGPKVETAAMTEAELIPFLRRLLGETALAQASAAGAASMLLDVQAECIAANQREAGLRANLDEIARHAAAISRIIPRGALRPDPETGQLDPAPAPASGRVDAGAGCPDDIRALGWAVAVHNDYRLNGEPHTFWLFTKDGRAIKGEGRSDAEALDQVRSALSPAATPVSEAETVTLTRQQIDGLLRAAYPLATASDRASALEAALAKPASSPAGWQDIKTAPHSKRVLVKFPSGEVEVCYLTAPDPPFIQTWRFAFVERGRQAPWPVQWCEIPGDDPAPAASFQSRVQPWMIACFGEMIAGDREERNHRFLEEALELVQSLGCTRFEAHQLVDYVFDRPAGDPPQEVGGVMVTLAALCLANALDMHEAGETELHRIWGKVEQIRAKQAAKPKHSPLPQHVEPAPTLQGHECKMPPYRYQEPDGRSFSVAYQGTATPASTDPAVTALAADLPPEVEVVPLASGKSREWFLRKAREEADADPTTGVPALGEGPWFKLAGQAIRALTLAVEDRSAGETVEMNVGDLCVVLGLLTAVDPKEPK